MSLLDRRPGDALPSELVLRLRTQAGLSQEAFAERLGLKGGRATVSAWETGKNQCEGPAAELILRDFYDDPTVYETSPLRAKAEAAWSRTGNPWLPYRQLVWSPHGKHVIPLGRLSKLWEETALPQRQVEHGFPFNVVGGSRYAVATAEGWVAVLPPEGDTSPKYLWLVDDGGRFLFREYCYESQDPKRFPFGNIGVGFLLKLAVQSAFYVPRLYAWMGLDNDCKVTAQYELHGAAGRGFVFEPMAAWFIKVPPAGVAGPDGLVGSLGLMVGELESDKVGSAIKLVSELVAQLDLGAADEEGLRQHLKVLLKHDKMDGPGHRELAFLDRERL